MAALGWRALVAIPAGAVVALGAIVFTGWLTGNSLLLFPVAGAATMTPATALALMVAGAGTLAALAGARGARFVRVAAIALLLAIALFVAAQYASDPASSRPPPMPLPTAIAVALVALLLATFDQPRTRLTGLAVQVLAGALLSLSAAALIAADVDPEAILPAWRFGRMAPTSAIAFFALGVALLTLIARSAWYERVYERRADERILVLTLGIFALAFVALAASALALLQRHLESNVQALFTQAVDDRTAILESVLANRVVRASIVANRPTLAELLDAWEANPGEAVRQRVRAEGVSYLASGFRGLAFLDAHERPIAESGVVAAAPALGVPVRAQRAQSSLLWDDGFVLRVRTPVHAGDRVVGFVVSDQELELLSRLQLEAAHVGRTAEWVLCAPQLDRMACFPQRFDARPEVRERKREPPLPMDLALAGRRGFVNADDYRGERSIAAYAPVGATGLGVVLKMAVEEFHAPLRAQMLQWGQWLAAIALLGALLVASQVRPVVQLLARSEGLARKRAEALARSERGLRELYESLGDGIVVFAPDGSIEFANPAAERVFGYAPGELAGKPVSILIPAGGLREANVAATRRFVESGASELVGRRGLVYPALRRDGRRIDIEFSLAEMRQEQAVKLVGVVRDVSERTALERMKSEFIAAVSHELRTPLTSIIGALELLREAELRGEEREFLDMAVRNGERLAMLVNDIIDVERIESGALRFEKGRFELAPFLAEAVRVNQPYALAHQVRFMLEEPVPQAELDADRGRLLQVMANLLSNAAKFSPEGSEVRVRGRLSGVAVRVEVEDRGRGIPPEFQPRVFDKFAQADASDSRDKGGSGLGLAICKGIVERSGGRIGFASRAGEGTTFWFELPAA